MNYTSSSPANTGTNIPVIANIDIRDCAFASLTTGLSIGGYNAAHPLTDVTVANCRFPANSFNSISGTTTARINLINNKGGGF